MTTDILPSPPLRGRGVGGEGEERRTPAKRTTMRPVGRLPVRCLLAALCIVAAGCRDNPVAPPIPPDAMVLLALDYYEPVYKVDADGRVTRLRLTWRSLPLPVLAEINK